MIQFIREAGFPIWAVLFFGVASLILSILHAWSPRRERLPLIIGFAVATVILGALGTTLGVQVSVNHIAEVAPDKRWIFLLGLNESLNNLVAALVIVAIDTLLTTAGAWRLATRREPEAVRAAGAA